MPFVSFNRFIQRMFGFRQQPLVDFAADEGEAEQKTEARDDVTEAIAGNVIEAACVGEALDLGPVDAVELGGNTEKGRHFVQAWPCGGPEPGKHVAEIDVIAAEAIPVVAATAMKQPR